MAPLAVRELGFWLPVAWFENSTFALWALMAIQVEPGCVARPLVSVTPLHLPPTASTSGQLWPCQRATMPLCSQATWQTALLGQVSFSWFRTCLPWLTPWNPHSGALQRRCPGIPRVVRRKHNSHSETSRVIGHKACLHILYKQNKLTTWWGKAPRRAGHSSLWRLAVSGTASSRWLAA